MKEKKTSATPDGKISSNKKLIYYAVGFAVILLMGWFFIKQFDLFSGGKTPKTVARFISEGDRALVIDSVEMALNLYFKAYDIDESNPDISARIAECYYMAALKHKLRKNLEMRNTMFDQSLFYLNRTFSLAPNHPYGNYVLGLHAYDRKQIDSALALMSDADARGVSTFMLHNILADLYNERAETKNCIVQLKKAYELRPDDPNILYNLGEAYYRTGNYSKAVDYQSHLIKIMPENLEYKANYAASLWKDGNEKAAKEIFNQILQNPTTKKLMNHHIVAWTLIDRDVDYEWGLKIAHVAEDLKLGDVTTMDILGWGYYKVGNYRKAVEYLSNSYNKEPDAESKRRLEMAQDKLKASGR